MKAVVTLVAPLVVVFPLRAGTLQGGVTLAFSTDKTIVRAPAEATYYVQTGEIGWGSDLTGRHTITQTGPAMNFTTPVRAKGTYLYTLEGSTTPGACYSASLDVTADGFLESLHETWASGGGCVPAATQPPPRGYDQYECTPDPCSPILLKLAAGGYALTSAAEGVAFDIDANGALDRVAWTRPGEGESFLWLDRNGNGVVDDGGELFGSATRLRSGARASNGFEALRELDGDGNGRVDAFDPAWGHLMLWDDANHDGISQRGEVSSLDSSDVSAIAVTCHWTGRIDPHGNAFRYEAELMTAKGRRPVYDIFFTRVP